MLHCSTTHYEKTGVADKFQSACKCIGILFYSYFCCLLLSFLKIYVYLSETFYILTSYTFFVCSAVLSDLFHQTSFYQGSSDMLHSLPFHKLHTDHILVSLVLLSDEVACCIFSLYHIVVVAI